MKPRSDNSAPAPRPAKPFLAAFALLVLGYSAPFFAVPLVGTSTRGEVLLNRLFLFDEDVAEWFGDPPEFSVLDRIAPFALAATAMATAAGLGLSIMRAFRWSDGLNRGEWLLCAYALGYNSLSLLVLLAGLAGSLNRATIILPAATIAVVAYAVSLRRVETLSEQRKDSLPAPNEPEWLSARHAWLGAPFLLMVVLGGLLPSEDFDALEYHLQAPKEFYLQGRIDFVPHNVYANMPLGVEMGTLWTMVAADDWWLGGLAGKLVSAMFAPLTAFSLWASGSRLGSKSAGLVAGLIFLSVPLVLHTAMSGLIDVGAAFFWWQAWIAVWRWRRSIDSHAAYHGDWRRLTLAGFLAGSAVSCKYPGALFVVAPLAIWVAHAGWKRRANGFAWLTREPAIFLLAAAVACGPWFLKNWSFAGNPTYPLLGTIFGGETRSPERIAQWDAAHRPSEYSLEALWRDAKIVLGGAQLHSPLIVPFAVAAIWTRRRRPSSRAIVAYLAFIFAAWWIATHRIDRFWLPALPFSAWLAGSGATIAAKNSRRLALGLLALGLAANLIVLNALFTNDLFASLDRLRQHAKRVDAWARAMNSKEISANKVLFVGRADVFNFQPAVLYNTVFDECQIEAIGRDRPPNDVLAKLQDLGVSHVLVDWTWVERYRAPGNYGFTDFVQPAVFESWVAEGVLAPALPRRKNWRGEELPVDVYPVR